MISYLPCRVTQITSGPKGKISPRSICPGRCGLICAVSAAATSEQGGFLAGMPNRCLLAVPSTPKRSHSKGGVDLPDSLLLVAGVMMPSQTVASAGAKRHHAFDLVSRTFAFEAFLMAGGWLVFGDAQVGLALEPQEWNEERVPAIAARKRR